MSISHPVSSGERAAVNGQRVLAVRLHRLAPGAPQRVHNSKMMPAVAAGPAGWLMRRFNDDQSMAYSTYKLYLCHIGPTWAGVQHPWNRWGC